MHALTEMWQKPQLEEGNPSSALPLVCSWGQCSSFRSQCLSCKKAQLELGSLQRPLSHGSYILIFTDYWIWCLKPSRALRWRGAPASSCHPGQIPPGHLCEDVLGT